MHPQAAWVVGPIPSWLEVGPLTEVEGIQCREVLGNWSHLAECDQPPKYLRDGFELPPAPDLMKPNRANIQQRLPGKPIYRLRGKRSGAVAILFNGPSLAGLEKLPYALGIPTIGMNRTHAGNPDFRAPQPDYLCVIDECWLKHPEIVNHPRLINGSVHRGNHGYRVTRSMRARPFSFDLWKDGYVCRVPCTTGHLALQLAVYLGFTRIYCFGLDLAGPHFDKDKRESPHFSMAVREHRGYAPLLKKRRVKVYLCGSPDSRAPFDHAPIKALLREAA